MKNVTQPWRHKSCLFLLLIALGGNVVSLPALAKGKAVVKPIAWPITGKVVTPNGEALPGVTVLVKGTSTGTATGADGTFSLSVPETPGVLVVSFVGFNNQEVSYNGPGNLTIHLTENTKALQEIVVVGYGTQRRKDLTGAVATVTEENFQKGVVTSPEQLIAGKVAGVQITPGSGAPGAGSRIRIRGNSSLVLTSEPLIVIDGVPVASDGIAGSANILNTINPNDIESMNILKDASAAAIYGSRAASGVIIITTKKGQPGKPVFNYSTQVSMQTPAQRVDVLSADEFRQVINERGNVGQKALVGNANTDWQAEIYERAITTDNNISVGGSIKSLPFRLSAGYLNQEGILRGGQVKRYSTALNLSPRFFNDNLRVDLNVKGTMTKNAFANEGAIGAAVRFDPTQPVRSGSENYGGYFTWLDPSTKLPNLLAPANPASLLDLREDESTVRRSIGNLQLDYKMPFLPALRANLNLGYDIGKGGGTVYVPEFAANQYNRLGTNNEYKQEKQNKLMEFYLNYTKDMASIGSRIEVLTGYSYQDFLTTNYFYPDRNARGETRPNTEPAFPFDKPQNTLVSFYGRINYGYKSRYLLTANLRRDGSSRFSPENRWGTFSSLAAAWNINEEEFLKSSRIVSLLKLRVGYGMVGQQEISNYSYLPVYALSNNTAQYQLGNEFSTMYRPQAYDANIKWEEVATTNAALDFGFVNDRISGTIEVYKRESTDLLNVIPIPVGSNFSNQLLTNIGNLENRGVEFTLNTTPVQKDDFKFDIGFNATLNKSEITKLTATEDPTYKGVSTGGISGGTGNTIQIHSVGYQPFSYYVNRQVYDEKGMPIEGLYVDENGDGVINENDRYRYKSSEPRVFLGINSALTFRKWSSSVLMRGSVGNYMYNNIASNSGVYRDILNPANFLSNGTRDVFNTNFTNSQYFSDYYVQNASFLRMENISLAYNFGQLFNSKANLRLSVNAQNVFVITKYQGIDPEVPGGIDNNFYPRPRTFVLGANINF